MKEEKNIMNKWKSFKLIIQKNGLKCKLINVKLQLQI